MGMADGRCFTINTASTLYNDYVMNQNNIALEDNYSYRKLLQSKGPELFSKPNQDIQGCNLCDSALLAVPDIY
jgi:hypothetical protein